MSYGVDAWNSFAFLPIEPTIDDYQCADSAVMSDRPDINYEYSSFCLGSMPTSHGFHLTVYPFQELSAVIPSPISGIHAISSPTTDGKSLLSFSL